MIGLKELRYKIMLALYFPILLYSFSTFDLSEETYAVGKLEPVVVGDQTVVLGQPFTARAFLTVAQGQGQQLSGAGDLEPLGDSLFQMQTAALLNPDENEKVVSYYGSFRFQQVGGAEAEIPVNGRFRVRRPEIVVTSEAAHSLYRQCLNPIRIDVPGLEGRSLRLKNGNREVDGRSIALSPSGETTGVEVYLVDEEQGDIFLGRKMFTAIDPPRPEIKVVNAGKEIRNGDLLPRRRAVLEFELMADENFRRRYPRDARYRVPRATVYLRKGLTASKKIGTFDLDSGSKLVLTRLLKETEPGDRVMIQLEEVQRINHAGAAVAVPLSRASLTFGFTIS